MSFVTSALPVFLILAVALVIDFYVAQQQCMCVAPDVPYFLARILLTYLVPLFQGALAVSRSSMDA